MRILLDTHVLIWLLSAPERLSAATLAAIDDADVCVSAASIWEIALKQRLGKLSLDPDLILRELDNVGFSLLPITGQHAAAVASLPLHHGDPFDRLLVAQALCEPRILYTRDARLAVYGSLIRVV